MKINVDDIEIGAGTQLRAEINLDAVYEYADAYKREAQMPPLVVVHDGVTYYLTDGFHRLHACREAGIQEVEVVVTKGTKADAQWIACSMNAVHGLRRTNADKRKAVEFAFTLRPDASDRLIAEHCGVSPSMVGGCRPGSAEVAPPRVGIDGKERKVPTKPAAASEPANAPESHREQQEPPEALVDGYGRLVPSKIVDEFRGGQEWGQQWLREEADLLKGLMVMLPTTIGKGVVAAKVTALNSKLRYIVREQMMPHAVCPLCAAKGCKVCLGRGWHSEETWRAVPDEFRTTATEADDVRF